MITRWHDWFEVVVCGADVERKNPDPEVHVRAVTALRLRPHEALASEDPPDGAAAATAAGVPVVVARSTYFAEAQIDGALAVGPGLYDRRGWRPALRPETESPEPVGIERLEAWRWLAPATMPPEP